MTKYFTLTAAAVAALAIGAPATAQTWQPGWQANTNARGAVSFDNRIGQLESRLDAGIRSRTIGQAEARRLRWELEQLRQLERQYSRGGIDQRQHADLQQRLLHVRQQIRTADRGSWDRYERPGEWAEYDDPYRGGGFGYGQDHGFAHADFSARIAQLETRLEAGIRSRQIDPREAGRLRSELHQLRRIEQQYSRGGVSQQQHAGLRHRIGTLRQQIRIADRGSFDRHERRGEWAEYDDQRHDPFGRDPYGRDAYGRGGPYEDPCAQGVQGGIGGVIGSIFGVGGSSCLRVGERAHANLGGVPFEYRNRFRDGGGLYYRSDGRAIYAIDARTNVVVEVHPIHQ